MFFEQTETTTTSEKTTEVDVVMYCELLEKEKNQIDSEINEVDWVWVNLGQELNGGQGDKESGGLLLEEFGSDQVTRIVVLHKKRQM